MIPYAILIKEVNTISYPFPFPVGTKITLGYECRPGIYYAWADDEAHNKQAILIVLPADSFEMLKQEPTTE